MTIIVSDEANRDLDAIIDVVEEKFGLRIAKRLDDRLSATISSLARMPTRHMRVPYLADRVADYRRALTGAHRVIFTLSADESLVRVVRVDLQSSDPSTLDDLP